MPASPKEYHYIPFFEFIEQEEFNHLKFKAKDFSELHKAVTKILRYLCDQKILEILLPEFDYKEEDFNGEFSQELEQFVKFEGGYFSFSKVFTHKTRFNTEMADILVNNSYFSHPELPFNVSRNYQANVPSELIKELNEAYEFSIQAWGYSVSTEIESDYLECAIKNHAGEMLFLDTELFGISLFVHPHGKVIETRIVNGKTEFLDMGALFVHEKGNLIEALEEDYNKLKNWILEKHEKHPIKPPIANNNNGSREGFVDYTYNYFTNKNHPKEQRLKITKTDINNIWDKELPSDSKWKSAGAPVKNK